LFCLPFLRFWSSESENYKNYTEINVTAAAVAGEENWIEINGHPAAKTTNQLKSSKQTTKASCSMDARASPSATATPSGTTNCGKFKTLLAEGAPHSRCQTRQVLQFFRPRLSLLWNKLFKNGIVYNIIYYSIF